MWDLSVPNSRLWNEWLIGAVPLFYLILFDCLFCLVFTSQPNFPLPPLLTVPPTPNPHPFLLYFSSDMDQPPMGIINQSWSIESQ